MNQPSERWSVSLVIPAYNEEARLGGLFEHLMNQAEDDLADAELAYLETVIVDDGSTDATSRLLSEASAKDDRLRPLLGRGSNQGKGAALTAGIKAARGDLLLLVDVDLSTPLSCAHDLAEAMRRSNSGMAIGSRDLHDSNVEAPLHRRVLGAGFNLGVRALTGLDHTDTQCGFKLIRSDVARELIDTPISSGFAFDVELLMRAKAAEVGVVEVPVTYIHDDRSRVRLLAASFDMAWDLVRISLQLRRARGHQRSAGK